MGCNKSKVSLTFLNPDVLQHNLVLTKKGKKEAVGALADAMLTDPDALKKNYVPDSEDIIASTKLVNPGGTDKIEFVAPSEPGEYPFICTFPGHWRLMQGIIKVIPSDENISPDKFDEKILEINDLIKIDRNDWHQIINPFEEDCHLIEIQYGSKVIEDDIERLYFYEENDG